MSISNSIVNNILIFGILWKASIYAVQTAYVVFKRNPGL